MWPIPSWLQKWLILPQTLMIKPHGGSIFCNTSWITTQPCFLNWLQINLNPRFRNLWVSPSPFSDKVPSSQSYGFSSSHVWMWELDHKEGWAPKNWCFWTVVLERTLESPLDSKEIQPVNSKGNPPWIFIGRTDAEAKAPTLWPPGAKS